MTKRRSTSRAKDQAAVVVGYVRVSTADQAEHGVSLAAQEERIRRWAADHKAAVLAVYVDAGLSGSRADNRPELQLALDHACHDQAALVFYSLSRLARSTRDTLEIAERIEAAGADLVSLTESIDTTSVSGRLIFRILSVLAEHEREIISQRTCSALAYKRSRGEYTGGEPPWGFEKSSGGHIIPNTREMEVTLEARTQRRAGASYGEILTNFKDAGITNRYGRPWSPATLHRLLAGEDGLTKTKRRLRA